MNKLLQFLQYIFIFIFSISAFGQSSEISGKLKWQGVIRENNRYGQFTNYLYFDGASIDPASSLPLLVRDIELPSDATQILAELSDADFLQCNAEETAILNNLEFKNQEIEIEGKVYYKRGKPVGVVSINPFRYNAASGHFEKLDIYKIALTIEQDYENSQLKHFNTGDYAEHSVLASGDWYKFRVSKSGIYKLGYQQLKEAGIDVDNIDPRKISIYGNAGGMLPEDNSDPRIDDLAENAIYVEGEADGSFDPQDYIIFYGSSPVELREVLGFFLPVMNLYDDYNYYYLTVLQQNGKRIEIQPSSTAAVSHTISKYNDYGYYEEDNINLIESGKEWYADEFGEINNRTYNFSFPDINLNYPATIKIGLANRTLESDELIIDCNDNYIDTLTLTPVSVSSNIYARVKKKTFTIDAGGPAVNVNLTYKQAEAASRMWLDYIYVNAISDLKMENGLVRFRELSSVADGAVTHFIVSNTNPDTRIWDVTDAINPLQIGSTYSDGTTNFIVSTDSLREFIAFDGTNFLTPEYVEKVPNQDLHGKGPFDLVIISHPDFVNEVERLKKFHENHDNMKVLLTTTNEIYNEFSSGKQDPTAIRDMMKLYYNRYENHKPKYLLLVGDGSYDPKDRIENNTNFIPTFQTKESWWTAASYVIDDYFGLLDDHEGEDARGVLDIGIGRFPVVTEAETKTIIDKIFRYIKNGEPEFGDWRTKICLIADDEDGNLHLEQADTISTNYIPPIYNQQKIYLDAHQQIKTPSGDKYPDVTDEINKQIADGALIMNYIGHGGSGGWAHERIIQINDIMNWNNIDKLPVFITATCEFSRFDEPKKQSAGELVLLSPTGGGVALLTTTRLAYSQSNFILNKRIYSEAFVAQNGEMPYLGDLIRDSKPPEMLQTRNFVLLGDPALKLAYPKFRISTTSINGKTASAGDELDTLHALQKIVIKGEVTDFTDQTMASFNGKIYPYLYDKPTVYKTFGNDPASYPVNFYNQDKILWSGVYKVTDGKFEFSFVIPKDMALNFGKGKLSYYAESDSADAFGEFSDFILGGIDENAVQDLVGPNVKIYLNDTNFVSGDITHENPLMIVKLSDPSGINTSSSGIGHEITAVLDDDYSNIIFLSSLYKADFNSYQSGSLTYPFHNLSDGHHTLTVKAWDSYNNPGEATIGFVIDRNAGLQLSMVENFPNPFTESTTFSFKHTRPGNNLDIQLNIFDLFGKFILSYHTKIYSNSIETPFLQWNGTDVNGRKVSKGVYIYTLTVTDEAGQTSQQQQKLIVQ